MASDPKHKLHKTAAALTRWIGSFESIAVHTFFFIACFVVVALHLVDLNTMLLALTTVVSLEAIYLALFIQMTVNYTTASIEEVEHDIDEIQEDLDEIQEDVVEMQEDDREDDVREEGDRKTLEQIRMGLEKLMQDVEKMQASSQK